ncbi:hypothetical protein Q8F55_003828 [Vanrija albida]|uniref:Uncharacterized protein n=1 Tax=Vanrija albida TaxID=181172 RepID=A0ABR3Q519_9TREE
MTPSNGEPSTPARPRPIAYAVSPDGDESSPPAAARRVEVELPARSSLPRSKTPVGDADELDVISLPATPPDNSGFEVLDGAASPVDLSEPLLPPRAQATVSSSESTWLNTNVGSSSGDSSRQLSSSGQARKEAEAGREEQRRQRELRELAKTRLVIEQVKEVEQRQADADDSWSPTKKKPKPKPKPKAKKEKAPRKTKASAPTSSASKRSTASSQPEVPVVELPASSAPSAVQSEPPVVELPAASKASPRKRKSDAGPGETSPRKLASPSRAVAPATEPVTVDDEEVTEVIAPAAVESGPSRRSPAKAAPAPQPSTPAPLARPLQPARSTPSGTPRTVKYKAASGSDNLASALLKLPGAKRSGLSKRLRIAPLHAHIGTPARVLPPPPPKPSKKKVESDDDSDDEGKIKVGSREWLMMED